MLVKDARVKVFGEIDEKTWEQALVTMARDPESRGAVSADNHLGYNSHPVGFSWASRHLISASGVGVDIACGNKAVGTGLQVADIEIHAVMDAVWKSIDFGIGKNQSVEIDHPVLELIEQSPVEFQRKLVGKAQNQLGSIGGGNHYVDLFEDTTTGELVVGVHFGSRGFGHDTCEHYVKEQGAFAEPTMFKVDSGIGQEYLAAMGVAGVYAYAGRDVVVRKVLDVLGVEEHTWEVHNHHNFAWLESHWGGTQMEDFWVVRKGCTPAFPGQKGFVGATMGENSVILEGALAPEHFRDTRELQEEALWSTVHGAGRAMSRGAAAGRKKKRWTCNNRDCDWVQPPFTHKPEDGACPKCKHPKISKQWVQIETGVIDWKDEVEKMGDIELRGGAADEAPGAYKRLDQVLAAQGGTITVLKTLRPVGVAMAPGHVASDD